MLLTVTEKERARALVPARARGVDRRSQRGTPGAPSRMPRRSGAPSEPGRPPSSGPALRCYLALRSRVPVCAEERCGRSEERHIGVDEEGLSKGRLEECVHLPRRAVVSRVRARGAGRRARASTLHPYRRICDSTSRSQFEPKRCLMTRARARTPAVALSTSVHPRTVPSNPGFRASSASKKISSGSGAPSSSRSVRMTAYTPGNARRPPAAHMITPRPGSYSRRCTGRAVAAADGPVHGGSGGASPAIFGRDAIPPQPW